VSAPEVWTVMAVENRRLRIPFRPASVHSGSSVTSFIGEPAAPSTRTHPGISAPTAGGYLGGTREYDRLAEAVTLNRAAALESASWGLGQIMGFNAAAAGFPSTEAMVAAMMDAEDAQIEGMATFMRSQKLDVPLAAHDWAAFARGYNGSDFAKNQYDVRLAAAFRQFDGGPLPDLLVRQAQVLLTFAGHQSRRHRRRHRQAHEKRGRAVQRGAGPAVLGPDRRGPDRGLTAAVGSAV
jgi:hypothetical protein